MTIIFIRHGKTEGNLLRRYNGRTDEPLCAEGITELSAFAYPQAEAVICSPMKRCIETAGLIYPDKKSVIYDGLRECDFGDFEGKSYAELKDNPSYIIWLESNGTARFPGGEAPDEFKRRSVAAFDEAVAEFDGCKSIALVVHDGTVMSVLERYCAPGRSYYDYHAENGGGYVTRLSGGKIDILSDIARKTAR